MLKKLNKAKVIFLISIILAILCVIISVILRISDKEEKNNVEETQAQFYIIEKNYQYGIIDLSGNIIIEPKYDDIEIPNPAKDVFWVTRINENELEEVKIINKENKELFNDYENVTPIKLANDADKLEYEKDVLKYELDEKYGILNYEGKKITEPIYDKIESLKYKSGELLVKKEEKYGVINTEGKILVKLKYDNIEGDGYYNSETKYSYTGYITCQRENDGFKYGYIDNLGKQVLKNEYSEVYRIIEAEDKENIYLVARKNGKVGFIKNDKKILDYDYQSVEYDYLNGLIKVQKNVNYGVFNINGEEILPIEYTEISFRGKYIYAQKENDIKYYTLNGQIIKNLNYLSVNQTDNENYYTCINSEGLYGILDKNENILVENEYKYIEYLYGEYFIAIENEKLGIIKSNNDIMIPFEFDTINKIENSNVIIATKNDKGNFIFKNNIEQVDDIEEFVIDIEQDKIVIYSENGNVYLDKEGNEITNKEVFINNELFAKKQDGKWGFEDQNEKNIINCEYDYVTEFNSYGFAGIKLDGKWGVINKEGKVLLEPKYQIEDGIIPNFIGEYYTLEQGIEAIYITE